MGFLEPEYALRLLGPSLSLPPALTLSAQRYNISLSIYLLIQPAFMKHCEPVLSDMVVSEVQWERRAGAWSSAVLVRIPALPLIHWLS